MRRFQGNSCSLGTRNLSVCGSTFTMSLRASQGGRTAVPPMVLKVLTADLSFLVPRVRQPINITYFCPLAISQQRRTAIDSYGRKIIRNFVRALDVCELRPQLFPALLTSVRLFSWLYGTIEKYG